MDTDALRTVALVARLGSFAAAARAQSLDPSAVSRVVASAEARLGFRLFQRTTRRLALTDAGALYLERIVPLLDELDMAAEEVGADSREPSGLLRLTASVAFAQVCITPLLATFRQRFPGITLELIVEDANADLVAQGIDLAIRLAEAPHGDLISTRLMDTRYLVCASPDWIAKHRCPEKPAELAATECLRSALPEFRDRWIFRDQSGEETRVPVTGWFLTPSALALRAAALDGLGPALLPDWLVTQDLAKGRLTELFPQYRCAATGFSTGAWALYPSRAYLPHKVRATLDFFRSELGRAVY
ncbi:LysR family transcriptional regulator [uncultured Roseobacter sp.]|uniref:LysR family transcriptional regulator n=1 Tax=uncultured Roseobacter sp. TaxID=114847 RepID=UPI0026274EBA|nr:LysR family transcriptional regulator [uncultured Roseobacter sp.]